MFVHTWPPKLILISTRPTLITKIIINYNYFKYYNVKDNHNSLCRKIIYVLSSQSFVQVMVMAIWYLVLLQLPAHCAFMKHILNSWRTIILYNEVARIMNGWMDKLNRVHSFEMQALWTEIRAFQHHGESLFEMRGSNLQKLACLIHLAMHFLYWSFCPGSLTFNSKT